MPLSTTTATDPRTSTTWEDFKEVSRKLDRYYRRDYSPCLDVLKALFPMSYVRGQLHIRTVPFIRSFARRMAKAYLRPPIRRFVGIESPKVLAMVEGAYKRMGINATMRVVNEMLWIQENACIFTAPDDEGRLYPHVLPPWRVEPITKDAMVVDPRSIKEWRLTLPRQRQTKRATSGSSEDTLILTATTAMWEQQEVGAWNSRGENPCDAIPLIVARASEPEPGNFYAPLPDDLLALQEALIVDHTDAGKNALFSQGQKCVEGMTEAEVKKLRYGSDVALALDEGQKFYIESADPRIDDAAKATNNYASHVLGMLGIDAPAFIRSTTITAAAKIAERMEQETERQLHMEALEEVEQRLYRHVARWTNAQRDKTVMPVTGVTVEIEHQEVRPVMDPLHEAQALALRVKMGLDHPAEVIARERGISREKAEVIWQENRKARRELEAELGERGENLDDGLDNSAGGAS